METINLDQTINPNGFQQTVEPQKNIFDNNQPVDNKPKKNKLKLIIGIFVFLILIIIITFFIKSFLNKNKSNNNFVKSEIINSDNLSSQKITKAPLSLYNNNIEDSNYLSVLLYNPLKDRNEAGDRNYFNKAIAITYNLGENFKNQFINNGFITTALEANGPTLKYYFGLTNDKYIAYQATSTTFLNDGSSSIGTLTNKSDKIYFYKREKDNNLRMNDEEYKNDYNIYGSNWVAINKKELENISNTERIDLIIGKNKNKNIYSSLELNKFVDYGDNFIQNVDQIVNENGYKDTLTILDDINNLNSVSKIYGHEIDLNKTVFYQDIVAKIISNEYGLNLRNKDFFTMTDARFIKYKAYTEDNYLTEIFFEYPQKKYFYDQIKSDYGNSSYEYSYNNNFYSYFADLDLGFIYVFNNKNYVGKIRVTHRGKVSPDIFKDINYFFGIKK